MNSNSSEYNNYKTVRFKNGGGEVLLDSVAIGKSVTFSKRKSTKGQLLNDKKAHDYESLLISKVRYCLLLNIVFHTNIKKIIQI